MFHIMAAVALLILGCLTEVCFCVFLLLSHYLLLFLIISGGKDNVSLAESLNQARLPIIDHKTCRQKKFWGDRVRESMICAGFRDTGGPPAACQVNRSGDVRELRSVIKITSNEK